MRNAVHRLSDPLGRLRLGLLFLLLLLSLGTVGYTLMGLSPFDAFYMTLITVSTVGFSEIGGELTTPWRMFTAGLILSGVILVAFSTASFIEAVVEGGLASYFGRRRMAQKIAEMEGHWIVCGYGRMGELVCKEILRSKNPPPVVVIDRDAERARACEEERLLVLEADATHEETLEAAGIERAYGLVSLVASDAENVYIALTARGMNARLVIVARALEDHSEKKLRRAGADKVVSPYTVGGHRLAQAVLQPVVAEFLEFAAGHDLRLEMEETVIQPGTQLVGTELRHSGLRSELDLIVLAIRRANGEMLFNPKAETRLEALDTLIALGPAHCLDRLKEWAGSANGRSQRNPSA
ncbi:MAG: potassium channel protein [Planctomycetota bacterium]|nr:MAG: potassium channel protein [Planctomycetota bacterium]